MRKLRREFKSGALSAEDYERAIDQQISYAIGIQASRAVGYLSRRDCWRRFPRPYMVVGVKLLVRATRFRREFSQPAQERV